MYIIVCRRAAPGRGRQELLPVRRTSHSSVIHQPGGRGQVSARDRGGRPARVIGWKGSVHLHGSTRLLGCPSADQTYLPFHSSIHPCPLFLPNLLANPSFSSSHSTSPHPPDHRSNTDKQTTAPILSSRTTARTAPSATPVRQIDRDGGVQGTNIPARCSPQTLSIRDALISVFPLWSPSIAERFCQWSIPTHLDVNTGGRRGFYRDECWAAW
jgi:hypothetical protein